MAARINLSVMAIMIILASRSVCADPDMLQDFCVADLLSSVRVNGYVCKSTATAEDFFFAGLALPGTPFNAFGSLVAGANVQRIPGLNTLGVSLARIDFAPGGLNPPHTHPRATEILIVLYGELQVGFITISNVLFTKTIKGGEVFVFPKGLVHFQKNNAIVPAVAFTALNSQLPGTQSISTTLFGASPPVPDNVLATAFKIDINQVQTIKSKFTTN